MAQLSYRQNTVAEQALSQLLDEASDLFTPPLKGRMDLAAYAHKLKENAEIFEVWHEEKLVAFVAVYMNDFESQKAFIPLVLCRKEFQHQGIMSSLFTRMLAEVKQKNFRTIALEVQIGNIPALALYQKFGFTETARQAKISMEKQL